MIDNYKRYQIGLTVENLFPKKVGTCACGCGREIPKHKKWYSRDCTQKCLDVFFVIKGDNQIIRKLLFQKEQGFCRNCGVYDENWQADHILAVHKGGGGCSLDNFQTLCTSCHKEKSANE